VSAFQPGDVIGRRYRLIELLGAGAMGVVWSARNEAIDRSFAIKLMRPDALTNPNRVQRFFREAKAAGRLRHRCIVEVYDIDTVDESEANGGTPYLVMELLEGEPLDALLKRMKRLPVGTALAIASDVARGLHRAHEQRIVHRDLKPGNLFLHRSIEEDGRIVPKVLDFGVSKLLDKIDASETTIGTVLGSPGYMSPEQTWGAEDLDGRADVWSLGVVLYKTLSGALPFEGSNFHAMLMAINSIEPKPLLERVPEVPTEVCAVVHKCLEKKREKRFESALAFAEAVEALRASRSYPTLDLSAVVRTTRARDSVKIAHGTSASAAATASRTRPTPTLHNSSDERTTALMHATATATATAMTTASTVSTTATSPTLPLLESKIESTREDVVAAGVAEASEPSTLPRRRSSRVASILVLGAVAIALVVVVAVKKNDDAPSSETHATSAPTMTSSTATTAMAATAPPPPPPIASASPDPATMPKPIVMTATPSAKPAPKITSKPAPPTTTKKLGEKPAVDPAHEGILHAGF
jgi:serine/threonine-protein kinase